MSAGRLYDRIGNKAKGKIVFVVDGGVVCKITDAGLEPGAAVIENDMKSDNTLCP